MMNKLIIFLIFLFCAIKPPISVAQKTVISSSEMHEDLDYLNKYLKKWHPAYYVYTPKVEMNAFYSSLKSQTDSSQSVLQFIKQVRLAAAKVGCGHIGVIAPKKLPTLDSALCLPFDINILDKRIFIRKNVSNDSLLKIGDEIISINGIKADSLLQLLGSIMTTDGYNQTHLTYLIESAFFIRYLRFFDQSENSVLAIQSQNEAPKSLIIKNIYRSKYQSYQRNTLDSSKILIKGKNINLQKTDISDKTFLIDFNAFSGPHLRKSYRQIFKFLKQNKAENLIIDLRDNGGGNLFAGYNFMKYLVHQPIQFLNISRKPNLTIINPRFRGGLLERTAPLFFMVNPLQYPSKNGWNHAFFFIKHFKNHYHNNLYVITNGMSFSTAALTATLLKNKANAIIVGEETGGSSFANRGMAQGRIVLPNSKIQVQLNVYQLKYGKSPDTCHGVMPDYAIEYNFEERNTKKDKEMERIKELVN